MKANNHDIVIVEDSPDDAELILRAFRRNNISNSIHVISDGAEALEYFFAKGKYHCRDINSIPKLVILDLKLPKVDGFELLQHIKLDERTKVMPVVILTSSKEERDVIACYKLGANSYIVKPVDFDQFMTTVRDLGQYWMHLNISPQ